MCTGLCQRVIQPTARLSKMLNFLKILMIINLIIPVLRIIMGKYDDILNDFLCLFILWGASESCHFLIAGFYIMFIIINNLISFFLIGAYVQAVIQGAVLNSSHILFLCINIFIFLFYSFAVIIVFPAYKEMKAIFFESAGAAIAERNNDMESHLRPSNNNQASGRVINQGQSHNASAGNNNNHFVPFSGRGMQLG